MRWMWISLLAVTMGLSFGAGTAVGQGQTAPSQTEDPPTGAGDGEMRHENSAVESRLDTAVRYTFLRVGTNLPEAILFADSLRIGTVTSELAAVPASTDRLRLVPPDANTWSVPPVERQVELTAGDTVDVALHFPYYYRVESIPYDASVFLETGDALRRIGSTPLLYTSEAPLAKQLIIERPGYVMVRIEPGSEVWNRHVISLSPTDDLDPTAAQVQWKPPKKHRAWIDYAAIGTALAAGAVAVHYKFKADDLYDEYEQSGEPSLRPRIHHFDVRSGVALGVMQLGIGVFAIRLALR